MYMDANFSQSEVRAPSGGRYIPHDKDSGLSSEFQKTFTQELKIHIFFLLIVVLFVRLDCFGVSTRVLSTPAVEWPQFWKTSWKYIELSLWCWRHFNLKNPTAMSNF